MSDDRGDAVDDLGLGQRGRGRAAGGRGVGQDVVDENAAVESGTWL